LFIIYILDPGFRRGDDVFFSNLLKTVIQVSAAGGKRGILATIPPAR
jgi:hypothetical protein